MELVNQQEPLRKSTVKRVIENTFNVVRSHMTHIETYGVFGEVLFGKTFLEQIRRVDASMKRVADYFVDGGDADGLPMEKLDMTREYVQYMLRIIDGDNIDAAYIAALFRIKTNINTALKYADTEVKNAPATEESPATEVKKEKKPRGRKIEPLSAIILEENLPEDEHGNKRTAQDLIDRLREMINRCERPTDVQTILRVAWGKKYLLRFPTENQYNEIGAREVGSFSTIRRNWQNSTGLEERFNIF